VGFADTAAVDLRGSQDPELPGFVYELEINNNGQAQVVEIPLYSGVPWGGSAEVVARAVYGESHRSRLRQLCRDLEDSGLASAVKSLADPSCKLPRVLSFARAVPHGSDLARLAAVAGRVEDAGFVLPWVVVPVEVLAARLKSIFPSISLSVFGRAGGAGAGAGADVLHRSFVLGEVLQPGQQYHLGLIGLPRLRTALVPGRSANGRLVLRLQDRTSMFLYDSESGPAEATSAVIDALRPEKLLRGLPQSLVLQNDQNELFVFVPSHPMLRSSVTGHPFTRYVQYYRGRPGWSESVRNRAYVFPVNVSGAFLQLPSVAATLYLLTSYLAHRQYADASKLMASLQTDNALGREESYTLGLIEGEYSGQSGVETGL